MPAVQHGADEQAVVYYLDGCRERDPEYLSHERLSFCVALGRAVVDKPTVRPGKPAAS